MATDVEVVAPPEDGDLGMSAPKRKRPVWRVVQILLAVAVVAISFLYAIPKIANYSEVWTEIRDMTRLELLFLFAAMLLTLALLIGVTQLPFEELLEGLNSNEMGF